jgi:hypothetical protein
METRSLRLRINQVTHLPSIRQSPYNAECRLDRPFLSHGPFRDDQTYHVSQARYQAVTATYVNKLPVIRKSKLERRVDRLYSDTTLTSSNDLNGGV